MLNINNKGAPRTLAWMCLLHTTLHTLYNELDTGSRTSPPITGFEGIYTYDQEVRAWLHVREHIGASRGGWLEPPIRTAS